MAKYFTQRNIIALYTFIVPLLLIKVFFSLGMMFWPMVTAQTEPELYYPRVFFIFLAVYTFVAVPYCALKLFERDSNTILNYHRLFGILVIFISLNLVFHTFLYTSLELPIQFTRIAIDAGVTFTTSALAVVVTQRWFLRLQSLVNKATA